MYFYSVVRIGIKDGGLYIKFVINIFLYSVIVFIISVIVVKKNKKKLVFNLKRKFLYVNWILVLFGIIFLGKFVVVFNI